MVQEIVRQNFLDYSKCHETGDNTFERRLLEASLAGDSLVVRKILRCNLIDVNARDLFFSTALSKASAGMLITCMSI